MWCILTHAVKIHIHVKKKVELGVVSPGRKRQADLREFEARLVYTAGFRTARLHRYPVTNKQVNPKLNKQTHLPHNAFTSK